jgi:hypothetical protein
LNCTVREVAAAWPAVSVTRRVTVNLPVARYVYAVVRAVVVTPALPSPNVQA